MDTSYKINKNINFQKIDETIFILNIDDGEYYELSDSASYIWNLISEEFSYNKILNELESSFEFENNIKQDLDELLLELENLGLIHSQ
tara:strand:- start:84 stop:347 length:264 start_codon:yes stop_codon:yes gene_type:complete